MGIIDYWCNAFQPRMRALWERAITAQGIPLKIRSAMDDGFAEVPEFVARLDTPGQRSW